MEVKVAKMIEGLQVLVWKLQTGWLRETRDKAIVKLNVIKPYIGLQMPCQALLYKKIIDPSKSLVENAIELNKIDIAHGWSKWNKPVDIKEWGMPAHMVNAYYNPQKNLIVFPAAILQAPFYSLEQSSSANYGGIGAVIAHKISHAFDSNGASFDGMVVSITGGQKKTMRLLNLVPSRSVTSLKVRILMVPKSMVS